jgi:hypothetical protein
MEFLQYVWPAVSGIFVVPIAGWIKGLLPTDFPIQSVGIALILSFITVWGLSQLLFPTATPEQIFTLALEGQVVGQITHAVNKTVKDGGPIT